MIIENKGQDKGVTLVHLKKSHCYSYCGIYTRTVVKDEKKVTCNWCQAVMDREEINHDIT